MEIFKKLLLKFGVDKAIGYTSLAKLIQAFGGFLTIFLISFCLSPVEQGYYYTFASLLAIQIFFELGLGQIIIQYVAHESIHLVDSNGIYKGGMIYFSRIASLLHLFSKWYIVTGILFFCTVFIGGLFFFPEDNLTNNVEWRFPWLIICVFSSLNLLISPFISFIEGLGKVKDVAFMRMISQIIQIGLVWVVLLLGGRLYAGGITSFILFIVSLFFLLVKWRKYLKQFWNIKVVEKISYMNEIFPYQWKIALSWISGYFIFQLFNPVLFKYATPVVAGQMGMTLAALNGIMALTLSWTSTKVPLWSGYISEKKYHLLDVSFGKTLKQSMLVCFSGLFCFIVFLYIINALAYPLSFRFLPIELCMLMSISIFINNIVNAWATYLRCHKKEPFLFQALLIGVLTTISTLCFGRFIGVNGIVLGYVTIIVFVSLPVSYYIFISKKKIYHE